MPRSITEITLPGTRIFPESITSTSDGTLIVGSLGHGNVSRIAPGSATVEEWIKPGSRRPESMCLASYADEKGKTLWVCSNNLANKGEATAAMAFDLKTGAPKGTYVLPGDGTLCNDIAVGRRWHGLFHRHASGQRSHAETRRKESGDRRERSAAGWRRRSGLR